MNFIDGIYSKGVIRFSDGTKIALSKEQIKTHDLFYKNYLEELERDVDTFSKQHDVDDLDDDASSKNGHDEHEIINKRETINKIKDIVDGKEHEVVFGIRPESIVKSDKGDIKTKIELSELLGDEYYVHFTYAGKSILAKVASESLLEKGEDITFEIKKDKIHLFDSISEIAIF